MGEIAAGKAHETLSSAVPDNSAWRIYCRVSDGRMLIVSSFSKAWLDANVPKFVALLAIDRGMRSVLIDALGEVLHTRCSKLCTEQVCLNQGSFNSQERLDRADFKRVIECFYSLKSRSFCRYCTSSSTTVLTRLHVTQTADVGLRTPDLLYQWEVV
jgi:hypothetical protein